MLLSGCNMISNAPSFIGFHENEKYTSKMSWMGVLEDLVFTAPILPEMSVYIPNIPVMRTVVCFCLVVCFCFVLFCFLSFYSLFDYYFFLVLLHAFPWLVTQADPTNTTCIMNVPRPISLLGNNVTCKLRATRANNVTCKLRATRANNVKAKMFASAIMYWFTF